MFVVLRIHNAVENKINRRQRKAIANSCVCSHSTEKGLPFFTLDVLETKKGIDWQSVSEKCGRYASRIVAPRTVSLPDGKGLNRFAPRSMIPILTFNTACRELSLADLPAEKISVTVTDRNSVMYSQIHRLLPFASQIRVITSKPEKYASACIKAMEENGAAIMLRSSYETLENTDIVICCDGVVSPAMQNSVIFAYGKKSCGKICFSASGLELQPVHRETVPESICPIDFAGALFELCGCFSYCNSCFSDVETSCRKCENRSAASCLQCVTKQLNS